MTTQVALSPMNQLDTWQSTACTQCGGWTFQLTQGTPHLDMDDRCLTWEHTRAPIKIASNTYI